MRCPECGDFYKTDKWYLKHLEKEHIYTEEDAIITLSDHKCYKCGKLMVNPDALGCINCGAWHGDPKLEAKKK